MKHSLAQLSLNPKKTSASINLNTMKPLATSAYMIPLGFKGKTALSKVKSKIESGSYSYEKKTQKLVIKDDDTNSKKSTNWRNRLAILADFKTMREGDHVYFFHNRMIYGKGIIKKVHAKMNENADVIGFIHYESDSLMPLIEDGNLVGVDTDDVLNYAPNAFRPLRMFWNLSFVKIDPQDARLLSDALLFHRQGTQSKTPSNIKTPNCPADLNFDWQHIAADCKKKGEVDDIEMLVETAVLEKIINRESFAKHGSWDFVHHQLPACPLKPIGYSDKIDIIAIKYNQGTTVIQRVLIIEIKNERATMDDIRQLMKYVDWIAREMTSNRYDLIEAVLLAPSFEIKSDSSENPKKRIAEDLQVNEGNLNQETKRYFTKQTRPYKVSSWHTELSLMTYTFNDTGGELLLHDMNPL